MGQISPDVFRPDANLNPREILIALQLPDWSQWLPHVHPKDAWGPAFAQSEFATSYGAETTAGGNAVAQSTGGSPALWITTVARLFLHSLSGPKRDASS